MSAYRVHEISFDLPASTVTRAQGGFKEGDSEVIGRWVQKGTGNTVVLVADNARPLGVITRIGKGTVAVALGPVVKGKRSGNAALGINTSVIGGTRQIASGGTAERGFVKAGLVDTITNASNSVGTVLDGGGTTTANTDGALVEVKLY